MIEKLKTIFLTLLVVTSLLQSFMLGFNSPQFDPIAQNGYVKAEPLGNKLELADLLVPDQIVLHTGNSIHSVLYPGTGNYNLVLQGIKNRDIEGFHKLNTFGSNLNWEEYRNKHIGVEVRFRDGIPMNLLQKWMQIKGETPPDNDMVTSIWITSKENKDELKTYFLTDSPNVVYEVAKADYTSKDLENFMRSAELPYHTVNGDYYLPNKPIQAMSYKLTYNLFTEDQLRRSLFVDPNITRNLPDKDGSIMTDFKRSLIIKNDKRWFSYSDSVVPVEGKFDFRENMTSAIQFINQHGGWNGKYVLGQSLQLKSNTTSQTILFRQYYDSLPIIPPKNDNFGFFKLTVQKGTVSNYDRPMIRDLAEVRTAPRREVTLAGGEELDAKVAALVINRAVRSVFPAYKPVFGEQSTIELVPVWAAEMRDGTYEYLE